MQQERNSRARCGVALWGGVECTIVRLGDEYRDEAAETGHDARAGDIDLIADLGISTIRYPLLWEKIAPDRPDRLDFAWTDERLAMLRERGIEVIAGLLHHGSGPLYTNLLDPDFAAKFADFAAHVADRYPWIAMWTPINEPLTTARFSALYGHWYPHRRDYPSFLHALVNQCEGIAAAMEAIRAVNPGALLVQTEDLGKTYSTAPLRYQAAHENRRRWLSLDLLSGRVGRRHPLRRFLTDAGISEERLERLREGRGRPDMIGINHYLTSERFLDHRIEYYPDLEARGNGRDLYVDAEAVRVKRLKADTGIGPRLREAWGRYRIPLAVTEVHHGCTRDEQLRWFEEVWRTASALTGEGVDLRAVTLWSLFGNVDWRSLLTRKDGIRDVGAFDTRAGRPRPTIIAKAASAFARQKAFDHPALDVPGWWRRPGRFYPWNGPCRAPTQGGRKLLITGATGTLGRAFARICERRGLPFCLTDRRALDICDEQSVGRALRRHRPWAVINTAGFVRVADAEREREACLAANTEGAANLARACAAADIPFLSFSSDLVFDGKAGRPYVESDEVRPAGVYGLSKARAEAAILVAGGKPLVIRTSAFFGPWDRYNFAWHVLESLGRGEPVRACRKTEVSPTFVPDLCHAALDLLIDGETGIWHLANEGRLSWHEFACRIAGGAGYDSAMIVAADAEDAAVTALASERGVPLRSIDEAIDAYLRDIGRRTEPAPALDLAAE